MSIFKLFGESKNNLEFKFKEPEDKAVFTCSHVIQDKEPVLYVVHDYEGDWQFLCGRDNHSEENPKIISILQVTEIDQSLNDLFEMPKGIGAERKALGGKWTPFKIATE
ncbi:hypothetical protein ACG2LH_17850 [Zhouia sp. PK063]|uniref:hypothetical protein n=1 Tax=Zhouia sp. PK063 TaxID=3373602 RepID=UPI0037BD0030